MRITKQLNGSYLITDGGLKMVYYFYTKKEAINEFKKYQKQMRDLYN
jgi:hypothetical protein